MRLVLDSSVVIAAVRPDEPEHADSRGFLVRGRAALASGTLTLLGPPELWLEPRGGAADRAARPAAPRGALDGLPIELIAPDGVEAIKAFLDVLTRRMRGRRPFANATDLVYLWAAWSADATAVTLDRGMLAYHGVVCDVTRPQHVRLG